jgi:hypothetical protein
VLAFLAKGPVEEKLEDASVRVLTAVHAKHQALPVRMHSLCHLDAPCILVVLRECSLGINFLQHRRVISSLCPVLRNTDCVGEVEDGVVVARRDVDRLSLVLKKTQRLQGRRPSCSSCKNKTRKNREKPLRCGDLPVSFLCSGDTAQILGLGFPERRKDAPQLKTQKE